MIRTSIAHLLLCSSLVAWSASMAGCEEPLAEAPTVTAIEFWSDKELVFHLDRERLASAGLTVEDLYFVYFLRLTDDKHEVEVDGRTLSLDDLSLKVTRREVLAEPFTVELDDGRQVTVTPISERVAAYMMTGKAFQRRVHGDLEVSTESDLGKTVVLSHIPVPGGQIPNYWDEKHVHYSLGEPLETFGTVEVRQPEGAFTLRVRVLEQGRRHTLGADEARLSLDVDPRFDLRLEVLEVLEGPSPYAVGERFVWEVHSPARALQRRKSVGEEFRLRFLREDTGAVRRVWRLTAHP